MPPAPAKAAMIGGDSQPALLPVVIASSKATRIPADSVAPNQSNRESPLSRTSVHPRKTNRVAATLMISTGTVRKNTARQPKESTTKPPMAGPVTAPTPTVVMIKPIARPFSLAGKAAVMMAIPVPWVMAAPTPCRMREGNSISNVGDIPDIAAPKTITNVPAMKTLLRPIRSDSRPMGRSKALMVRAYVITTHWIVGRSVWNLPAMVGNATLMLP